MGNCVKHTFAHLRSKAYSFFRGLAVWPKFKVVACLDRIGTKFGEIQSGERPCGKRFSQALQLFQVVSTGKRLSM